MKITSYISRERVLDEEELIKFKESEKYNPTLQMKFSLTDRNGNPLSDRGYELQSLEVFVNMTINTL